MMFWWRQVELVAIVSDTTNVPLRASRGCGRVAVLLDVDVAPSAVDEETFRTGLAASPQRSVRFPIDEHDRYKIVLMIVVLGADSTGARHLSGFHGRRSIVKLDRAAGT